MKLLIALGLAYLAYGVAMVLLHPRLIYPFFPEGGVLPGFTELRLQGAGGVPIYVQEHEGDGPVLVYFMGNAGSLPLFDPAFERHIRAGRHVIAMEYRGGGGRPGKPREEALKADALAVVDYAAALGRPLILQGYSMGSGLATHVAARREVAAVLLVAPFDAMCHLMARRSFLPACNLPFVDHWKSLEEAQAIKAPILVLHGAADQIIPPGYSEGFEMLPNVTRQVIPGAGHGDIGTFPAYGAAIESFLADL